MRRAWIGKGDVRQCSAQRTVVNTLLCDFHSFDARDMSGLERSVGRFARHAQCRCEHRCQPRVSCGAALNGIDHLRDAKAALDKADKQRQIAHENADAHGAIHHPFAALPDHHQNASSHQRVVQRRQTQTQPRCAQVTRGKCLRVRFDHVCRCGTTAKKTQHAQPRQ